VTDMASPPVLLVVRARPLQVLARPLQILARPLQAGIHRAKSPA